MFTGQVKTFPVSTQLMSAFGWYPNSVLQGRGFPLYHHPPTPTPILQTKVEEVLADLKADGSLKQLFVGLRSPLWIWCETTSVEWSARQPTMSRGTVPYGQSDVLLALSQSTMVSFHGPETKGDMMRVSQWASVDKTCSLISYDALRVTIWVRNEELKDSLPSPHTHCMWWNGKSSPSSSLLVQTNPVQWQCDKPVSYFCTVLPHNSGVACTNHRFSMLLLVLLSAVCMNLWIKFLWTSSAVRQHAKQRKMHTR